MRRVAILTALALSVAPALAGAADVLKAEARASGRVWHFEVDLPR